MEREDQTKYLNLLLAELKTAETKYKATKYRYNKRKAELTVMIDFKSLGLTNEKQREAWIQNQLIETTKAMIKREVKYNHLIRVFEAWKIMQEV